MPLYSPFTEVGQVQREVEEVRSKLNEKANTWELSTISSKVDSLEHTLREISTKIDGMESRLYELEEIKINDSENRPG